MKTVLESSGQNMDQFKVTKSHPSLVELNVEE